MIDDSQETEMGENESEGQLEFEEMLKLLLADLKILLLKQIKFGIFAR